MRPFKTIMAGNFGPIAVNNRLRQLHERIEKLEALIESDEPVIHAEPENATETAPDTATDNSADTVTFESFNWQESDDVQAMKSFAKDTFGLEIRGNKKADTVRKEIEGFLETQGA